MISTGQIVQDLLAILAGITGRHYAPKAARKIKPKRKPAPKHRALKHPKRKPKVEPEFVRVYDSVTITAFGRLVSSSTDLVAAYDDGLYDNLAAARRDYPHHTVLSIAIHSWDAGDFLDVEPGCCWPPSSAKAWLEDRRKERRKLIGLYGDRSTWDELELVPGIDLRGVVKWIADQNGVAHIPHGFDGCQYDGSSVDHSLNYDVSLFHRKALAPVLPK